MLQPVLVLLLVNLLLVVLVDWPCRPPSSCPRLRVSECGSVSSSCPVTTCILLLIITTTCIILLIIGVSECGSVSSSCPVCQVGQVSGPNRKQTKPTVSTLVCWRLDGHSAEWRARGAPPPTPPPRPPSVHVAYAGAVLISAMR